LKKNKNNPAVVWLSSLNSKKSSDRYTFVLNSLCKLFDNSTLIDFDWVNFNYVNLLELRQKLINKGLMASTINVYLSVFKSVFREAWRLDLIDVEIYMRIKDVRRVKGQSASAGRALKTNELRAIINFNCANKKKQNKAVRDNAIIALGYGAGLRIEEITMLNKKDIADNLLLVHGKGSIIRTVFMPDFTKKALNLWLKQRGDFVGAVFTTVLYGGHIKNKRIATRTIGNVIKSRQIDAKVSKFTPHDLRRSFGTHLLNEGVDILMVQKLMRHASVNTTRIYDRRDDKAMIKAMEKLPF